MCQSPPDSHCATASQFRPLVSAGGVAPLPLPLVVDGDGAAGRSSVPTLTIFDTGALYAVAHDGRLVTVHGGILLLGRRVADRLVLQDQLADDPLQHDLLPIPQPGCGTRGKAVAAV